ncbi:ArsR/SmtB family transcription factor [Sphingomonas japonica]|nr:metalloregulator ArsR/SmtB family transcription factor [Sphingomonas japonica]
MDSLDAMDALGALAQPTRLDAFRLLVRHSPHGLAAGRAAELLKVPQNSLSSHLAILQRAGLVASTREGRSILFRARLDRVADLVTFLLKDCCAGDSSLCAPIVAELSNCRGQP